MTPEHVAMRTRLIEAERVAFGAVNRFAAHFERAAADEPDPIRRRALERGADALREAIKTTFPAAEPLPRVRRAARPLGLAAWQSRRETDAAGRNSDALAVSPRRAGAP